LRGRNREGSVVEKLWTGIAGILLGTGILLVYAWHCDFTDWRVYTSSRIIGLLFGTVCFVAGLVYLFLELQAQNRVRQRPRGGNDPKPQASEGPGKGQGV
jgi:hypothetical protein